MGSEHFDEDWLRDPWLRLLCLVDHCNRFIKEGNWYPEDKGKFYELKDALMEKVYRDPPRGATVNLKLVPSLMRCRSCVDKAEELMRSDPNHQGLDFYLERVEPCPMDTEVRGQSMVEMEMFYLGRIFCFHIPVDHMSAWGLDLSSLERKAWIPGEEFHRRMLAPLFEEMKVLLEMV